MSKLEDAAFAKRYDIFSALLKFQPDLTIVNNDGLNIPGDPQLPAFLGRFYYKSQDLQKAKEYLVKAIELNPADHTLPALLGQVHKEIKTGLGWELAKKPWRMDLIKHYYVICKEIRAWKRANGEL